MKIVLRSIALGFLLSIAGVFTAPAVANQSATATYCTPSNTISGLVLSTIGAKIDQNGKQVAVCSGQPGDLFSDGPLFAPSFGFSGGSFNFTIPANVWVALGQRVSSVSTAEVAPTSATSWWWIDCSPTNCQNNGNVGVWEHTASSSAPDAFAALAYIVVANGSGITGVTNPNFANLLVNGTVTINSTLQGVTLQGTGAIVAGSGTAKTATAGDLEASRSTTTGALDLGGSSSDCLIDYGITLANSINVPCLVQVQNGVYALGINGLMSADNYIVAGAHNGIPGLLSGGDIYATESSTAGAFHAGGSSQVGRLDYGLVSSHAWSFGSSTANSSLNEAKGYILASFDAALTSAPTLANGDLGSSESATVGKLIMGGSTTSGTIDFGSTTAGAFTSSTDFHVAGNGFATGYITAGSATGATPTAGDLLASRSTSTGALVLGGSGSSCNINFGVTNIGKLGFNCGLLTSQAIQVGNVTDTGLSTTTVLPLCGSSSAAVTQCAQQSILYQTTGNTSAATGTTPNTYVQLGSNVSVTTGTSTGANGNWLITVEMPMSVASNGASQLYGCITSASTFTLKDGTVDGATGNCVTAKTNSFAGGPAFGFNAVSAPGLSQIITANLTVANSTTFTMSCFVAGSTSTSITVSGYCSARAVPF